MRCLLPDSYQLVEVLHLLLIIDARVVPEGINDLQLKCTQDGSMNVVRAVVCYVVQRRGQRLCTKYDLQLHGVSRRSNISRVDVLKQLLF